MNAWQPASKKRNSAGTWKKVLRVLPLGTMFLTVVSKMESTDEKLTEIKLPQRNISGIKNKQRRAEAFRQLKREKTKVSLETIE